MIAYIVRFKSALSPDEVYAQYQTRAKRYRQVPGLIQKYYLSYAGGEHGAVYLWDSRESLDRFRGSELARTIPEAYQVTGEPDLRIAEVVMSLREGPGVGDQG